MYNIRNSHDHSLAYLELGKNFFHKGLHSGHEALRFPFYPGISSTSLLFNLFPRQEEKSGKGRKAKPNAAS
jgi:hypothetical protein